MITKEKLEELHKRIAAHQNVPDELFCALVAVVVLSARELEELLDTIKEFDRDYIEVYGESRFDAHKKKDTSTIELTGKESNDLLNLINCLVKAYESEVGENWFIE